MTMQSYDSLAPRRMGALLGKGRNERGGVGFLGERQLGAAEAMLANDAFDHEGGGDCVYL